MQRPSSTLLRTSCPNMVNPVGKAAPLRQRDSIIGAPCSKIRGLSRRYPVKPLTRSVPTWPLPTPLLRYSAIPLVIPLFRHTQSPALLGDVGNCIRRTGMVGMQGNLKSMQVT